MPNEGARVRLCGGAHCLVVQEQLTRTGRPGDDQLRQGALADLPGTVDHHDAGIPQRFNSEPLGMPREQISFTDHGLRLRQLA